MPTPDANEEFLIRSRELLAAQRFGLAPPPGEISRKVLAKAYGMSIHTARKLERDGLLKLSDGLMREGLTLSVIRSLLSPPPES